MTQKQRLRHIETDIVHGTQGCHTTSGDLVSPIHMTSTFRFDSAAQAAEVFSGTETGYAYTRISNPTVDLLQEKLAALEGGQAAVATASGMAAIAAAGLSLAAPGDNVVACATLYGGTHALFSTHFKRLGIEARLLGHQATGARNQIEALIDTHTRFLFMETPANPTLDVIDIALWADVARKHRIPLIVDNTFASPVLQRPLALGADLVLHSATKYLCGHGDVIAGAVIGSHEAISEIRHHYIHHFGPTISPFNAWLVARGIKTLAVRMNRHCENALKIALWLEGHPKVSRVYYPGLAAHPAHELARRQMKAFGGMIAFEIDGGIQAGKAVMDRVKLCILAVSLGDCETLIQHPASMTHATYSSQQRQEAGISDGLIRLSVGIEHPDDIITDLKQALRKP
jgi:methionine-gamma-lyase